MGTRGPKKTPTALLSPDGHRAKYKRRNEPKPQPGVPKCPNWLCRKGRAVWRELAPKLKAAGILTVIDGNGLARYCELFVHWREAAVELRGEDRVVTHGNGVSSTNPLLKVVLELSRELARLESCFGLSPSDRAGLSVNSGDLADEPEHITRLFSPGKVG